MRFLLLLSIFFTTQVLAGPFSGLKVLTEEYPPYNYTENNQLKGISVDLLLKASGGDITTNNIKVWPWPRGYDAVQKEDNVMLFAMTRTEARDPLFKWVGPIADTKVVILVKKDNPAQSIQDLVNSGGSIGVIKDDIGETLSKEAGIPSKQLRQAPAAKNLAKMLQAGRIQGWAYEWNVALWNLKKLGESADNYRILEPLKVAKLYFALSKSVSDDRIEAMNAAVSAAK